MNKADTDKLGLKASATALGTSYTVSEPVLAIMQALRLPLGRGGMRAKENPHPVRDRGFACDVLA
jgi:hypothetical protein